MTKRKVHENVPYNITRPFDLDAGEVRIETIIKTLQDLKKRCVKAGYNYITLDIWSYEGINVDVCGRRPETEKERERRLKYAQQAKDMREKKRLKRALKKGERQLYEELKSKFESCDCNSCQE